MNQYLPILLLMVLGAIFAAASFAGSKILAPKAKPTAPKVAITKMRTRQAGKRAARVARLASDNKSGTSGALTGNQSAWCRVIAET